jgi:hypothetical protein
LQNTIANTNDINTSSFINGIANLAQLYAIKDNERKWNTKNENINIINYYYYYYYYYY